MKKIGFLSFGHWADSYGSQVRTAADSLLQSIELDVAAEELGADGAYFRVHHFASQLGFPFPALPATRPAGGVGGAGRRRRVLPRASLRQPARLAVPAPRGHRRAHQQNRDWD